MRENVKKFIYGLIIFTIIVVGVILKVDLVSILFTLVIFSAFIVYKYWKSIYKFIKLNYYRLLVLFMNIKLKIYGKLSGYINKVVIKMVNRKNVYLNIIEQLKK